MKVCFFARAEEPAMLDRLGYYREDIEILESLGHQVVRATKWREIPWGCDLYFTWWYGWGLLTLIKSLLAGRPNMMVGPIHYQDAEFGFFRRPRIQQWLIRLALRWADACVAVSQIEYQGLVALGARRAFFAYHSVPIPESVRRHDDREPLVFSIGHLCRIGIARKAFDNVVRAIPFVVDQFPQARFVIAGRIGVGFEKLESLVRELGVEPYVHFPGAISAEARSGYLQRAMVLAQPAAYEGFGLAQLEAMAHGVPVVTSPAGAIPEVVADCALYTSKDAPREIARHICKLLGDPLLWEKMSRAGRKRAAAQFSREQRQERLKRIIDTVLRERSGAVRLIRAG